MKVPNTTKENVSLELINLAQQHGGISETIINSYATFSRRAVRTHFGSIAKAAEELLISTIKKPAPSRLGLTRKTWTKEDVIATIQQVVDKRGYFSKGLIDVGGPEYGLINHKVIVRIWGSFSSMYEETGFPQKPSTSGVKIISDEEYLKSLKDWCTRNNVADFNSYFLNKYMSEVGASNKTFQERFLSVENLARLLGLNYVKKWQSEESAILFVANTIQDHSYVQQYKHNEIKLIRRMPIDAFWPKLDLCLEYQGPQHYDYNSHFHKTIEEFENQLRRDALKHKQINDLNFKLLLIKYDDTEEDVVKKLQDLDIIR